MAIKIEPDWLTTKQLAEMLGVSRQSIRKYHCVKSYRHLNFPQPSEINGKKFWKATDIDQWMRSRVVKQTAA